jgi:hypothetical protein
VFVFDANSESFSAGSHGLIVAERSFCAIEFN